MQPSIEGILKLIDEVLQLLKKSKLKVSENIEITDHEKQGEIYVLDMVRNFCIRVRKELVAEKWPKRPVRAMRSTALFRAIEDMGWYSHFDDSDNEANRAFRLFEKVKKSYRRLPEVQGNVDGSNREK